MATKESIVKTQEKEAVDERPPFVKEIENNSLHPIAVIYTDDGSENPEQLFVEDILCFGEHSSTDNYHLVDHVCATSTVKNLLLSKQVQPGYAKIDRNNMVCQALQDITFMEMELSRGKKRKQRLL